MQFDNFTIERPSLLSNITREFVGERTFNEFAALSTQNTGGGGVLGFLFNTSKRFLGFLLKSALSFIEWSFTGLWELIVESTYELVYFDWNQSDAEIQAEINSGNNVILQQFGQLIGSGSMWIASIAVSSALTVKFPVLAGRVALALAEEGSQTLRGQLTGVLSNTTQTVIRNLALASYIGIRKLIKGTPTSKSGKPWTIAEKIDEKVNNIPSQGLRQFTQGVLDGVLDSIIDIGYVVSFTLDDFYAASANANSNQQPIRRLEIFPDGNSDESILLEDQQDEVEAQLNNYLSAHSLVSNRDIGTVVGQPYDDWYTLTPQGRKLLLEFNGKEKPPFIDSNGDRTKRVQISIPDAKPGISWNDLKAIRPFTWGNYMARGVFENRRQMSVWGSSESEAKNTLLEFAKLSTKSLVQVSVSHPEIQNPSRKKKPTRVYPVAAVMLVRKATQGTNSTTLIDGQNRETARTRVELWRDDPPQGFSSFQ
ncbi:hypothetical protein H6G11_10085 [Cyanobacterium aponinum FACHB-4101]|uniref:hypothetical protein n=1 Tax=Cyanobacterium aponinum TaxID=379064 RepID=UPI001680FA8F|nr:hypothetical protein [Cyanobacterium aponinum]MBD2394600.1 hypothetical protein [Cyanobacterium aponinum FACHB-4101]